MIKVRWAYGLLAPAEAGLVERGAASKWRHASCHVVDVNVGAVSV